MTKTLFNQFPEVSSKQWKQKIQADLKGADYNDTLIWQTNEGIDVKPFYHQDSINQPLFNQSKVFDSWKICQTIYVQNIEASNSKALDAINRGADCIKFIIPNTDISIADLCQNINFETAHLRFELLFLDDNYVKKHANILDNPNVFLENDIIGNLGKTGNWYKDLKSDHIKFENIVTSTKSLRVDLSLYQNAGANMVQQLAYSLGHINEYFNHFDALISYENKKQIKIVYNVAVGSNYFFEIGKLRALRILHQSLAQEYGFNTDCFIFASPSKRNKTIYDYNTNMLRTTTECMSAILGEADAINNTPYDVIYHKNNEFGDRIARNQLLVLKHESYFDKVDNPADGTYYIEEITNQLTEKALSLFKDLEVQGGFLNALKEGTIQRKIKDSANKEQEQFDKGQLVLLGTNKHPNENDKMNHELELYPFVKTNIRKTLIEPIIEKRLSEKTEQERLKTE